MNSVSKVKIAVGYTLLLGVLFFSLFFVHREMEHLMLSDNRDVQWTDSLITLLRKKDANTIYMLRVLSETNDSMVSTREPWPLAAALLGGVFVGIGVGIIVRQGGSSGGDDALALVIHQLTGWKLARSYLFTDLVVLGASLSYIPARRIAFSLVTVTVSSLLIDWVQGLGYDKKIHGNDAAKRVE